MNLKDFKSWEKQTLVTLRKGDEVVYLVTEHNPHYGRLITKFQHGRFEHRSLVKIDKKYCGKEQTYLECAESISLLGERPFERGSCTWEFLWKTLGIPYEREVNENSCDLTFTDLYYFLEQAEKQGWERTEK